jgi:hypothetical protein
MAKHYVQRPVGRPELRKLRVLAQAEENRFFTVNRYLVAPYRGRLSRRRRLKDVSRRARTPHRQAPDAVLDRSEDVVDLDRRRSRVRRASSATRRLRRGRQRGAYAVQAGADGLARGQQRLVVEARVGGAQPGDREDGRAQHRRGQAEDRLDRQAQAPGHPRAIVWLRLAAWDS